MKWLHTKYLKLLQILCRRELKKIADDYPQSNEELIKYHDYMAILCINAETKAKDRVLGISVATANALEGCRDQPRSESTPLQGHS